MTTSNYPKVALRLSLLDDRLVVCRLEPDSEVPDWATESGFSSITRTLHELSIVCTEEKVPDEVVRESGWRALVVEGPLDFSLVGILASVVTPLAEAGISVFAISTYDTDYLLVRGEQLDSVLSALRKGGHELSAEPVLKEVFTIRPAKPEDQAFLWKMLSEAAQETTVAAVAENPDTARYVGGWGREGDLGFVAVSKDDRPIGAAWLRMLIKENRGYGYLDDETPELAIAVHPDFRGMGVGVRLLAQLLERAKDFYNKICLSVRANNPALHLYEKMGFGIVQDSERTSHTGGSSFTMRRDLN